MTLNDYLNANGQRLDKIQQQINAQRQKIMNSEERWGENRRFAGRNAGKRLDRLYELERRYSREWERLRGQFERQKAKIEKESQRFLWDAKADPEAILRALWDKQGIPKERQDEIIREVEQKAKPGAMIGPFKL